MSNAKTVMSQAANTWAGPTYIEDVFSTYLYTGNGSTQTITNGIDLAGEGGLVWSKNRNQPRNHNLVDTERGVGLRLKTNSSEAEYNEVNGVTSFNSDGYSLSTATDYNANGDTYASWTFRKAPRFFDVVTYTGDGVAGRTVAHNLGSVPGCMIVKKLDGTAKSWAVYHKDINNGYQLYLDTTSASVGSNAWNYTDPTDSVFTLGNNALTNTSGNNYVAYLFAHDPLGPSGDGSDGLIACGSFTAAANVSVDLGWEPQWVLTKNADDDTGRWKIVDNMRGFLALPGTSPYSRGLYPNLSNAEGNTQIQVTPTGFAMNANAEMGFSGTCIYIAIRRGPMRQPTSGTEVFAMDTRSTGNPSFTSGFPVDFTLWNDVDSVYSHVAFTRLLGQSKLETANTGGEVSGAGVDYRDYYNTGIDNGSGNDSTRRAWMFRRAPGFFDVVAYTGTGVARTVQHNLGVAPEMIWVKSRNAYSWTVYHSGLNVNGDNSPETDVIYLDVTNPASDLNTAWNDTAPTDASFTVGTAVTVNRSGYNYIAYLFATLPGVSKVGSYTGNGTSQTIDCGFTSGARFILIKRTDSTGDWYVWDTARGIVAANDPHLSLNTTAAEVTTDDSVDPDNSGFIVNQVAATNINVNAATYIFYAIA